MTPYPLERRSRRSLPRLFSSLLLTSLFTSLTAYSQAKPQIVQSVTPNAMTPLKGSVHPLVTRGATDLGAVTSSAPSGNVMILLKRPAAQEKALQQFLADVHTQGSSQYHHWLTPAQFGQQFGPADSDIAAISTWLQAQGFKVSKVGTGKNVVEFSGTAGQIDTAFHTSLHNYIVNGETHHANAQPIQIPSALAPAIAAVGPMNDFAPRSYAHRLGKATFNPATHKLNPQFTISESQYDLGLAPADIALQYDVQPLYNAGVTGAGQTIGIINDSNVDIGVVASFRKLFHLDGDPTHPNLPQVVIEGEDPGVNGDSIEAYLDVEEAGAIAPDATIRLYASGGSDYSDGLSLAVVRAVDDDAAPILSLSFGGCEALNAGFGNAFYNSEWQQAAAQGQTVLVSSGDADSAGCDTAGVPNAQFGRQVNGLGSTPWNISVGGTDFYYSGGLSSLFNYWNATNDNNLGSLKQSLPEQPWNDSRYGFNLGNEDEAAGGGGGQSACAVPGTGSDPITGVVVAIGNSETTPDCSQYAGYPKPSWQVGPGVPADGVRDLPDVALFAANGDNASSYVTCESPDDCSTSDPTSQSFSVTQIGGTSASTPVFAGLMALVNQKYGPQGQANSVLYPLAQQFPAAFHDIAVGSNAAPCDPTTTPSVDCVLDNTGSGSYWDGGFSAGPGYDMASGLGSVDAFQMVTNWNKVAFSTASVTLNASATNLVHGQPVTLTTSVSGTAGGSKPTGAVSLVSTNPQYASKGLAAIALDANGSGTLTTSTLPGGSYSLVGQYSGDALFSGSTSSPVVFTIAPESSIINATVHAYSVTIQNGAYVTTDLGPVQNGATYPYATAFVADLHVTGSSNSSATTGGGATGSTSILDNGTVISTNSLDTTGTSSYQNLRLPAGSHSFSFNYSGDLSYKPTAQSTLSVPLTFAVAKATPQVTQIGTTGQTILIGSTLPHAIQVTGVTGAPPTGTITLTAPGLPTQTITLTPEITRDDTGTGTSYAAASYPNMPAGNYTITASYSGDANWAPAVSSQFQVSVAGTSPLLPSTATLSFPQGFDPSSVSPSSQFTVTMTVTGGPGATATPTGLFAILDNSTLLTLAPLPAGSGTSVSQGILVPASILFGGVNHLQAVYIGDTVYQPSYSPYLSYSDNNGDFTLASTSQSIVLPSGQTGVSYLKLLGLNDYTGSVSLSCKVTGGPAGNTVMPNCIVPATTTINADTPTQVAVQIDTGISPATSALGNQAPSESHRWMAGIGGTALASVLLLGIPARRRNWRAMLSVLLLLAGMGTLSGCSSSFAPAAPSNPAGNSTLVPAGVYTAVVTATTPNGSATHNVTMTITVQKPTS